MVIRQVLDKYGLEDADPRSYCLVMRTRYAKEDRPDSEAHEEILPDTTCPLSLILIDRPPKGVITTFEVSFFPLSIYPLLEMHFSLAGDVFVRLL